VTPPDALEPTIRETVIVDGRRFLIQRPDETEVILDHPAIRSGFAADEYLPYWTELWPASRMLAKAILRAPLEPGLRVLELGCGLGLPGIAALARGLWVTFSDCDATALRFAAENARLNGFAQFDLLQMDWRFPPADTQFPLILASDVIYELRNINPVVALIKRMMAPGGMCLLTDQDRLPSYNLREALEGEDFAYASQILRAGEPGGRRVKGTLYRITRARRY
jgi:predicted nicotinamide N-methyase